MHVPHDVTTSAISLVPLVLSFLLILTSGCHGGWGQDGRGAGTASMDRSGPGFPSLEETAGSVLCDNARLQCTMRMGCQMALNNFFEGCQSILVGQELQCTTACQHALVSLLATEDGAGLAFMHCNCSGQEVCEERKRRVHVCQRRVLQSMTLVRDREATLSCTLARWICEADTSCLAALQYYVQHCSKLFTGTRCTARCRNSVHILYRQPNAHKLRTCRCEGDEDYDCPSLVNNTERLCLQRHRHDHHPHHNHSHHHHRHVEEDSETGEEGSFRQPGRQPAASIKQLHTSGQTSGPQAHSSEGSRMVQHGQFRRRQWWNKSGRKKKARKRPMRNSDISVQPQTKRHRRVLKRRTECGRKIIRDRQSGVRRSRQCTGRKKEGRWRKRRSNRRGRARRNVRKCCRGKTSR